MKPAQYYRQNKSWSQWLGKKGVVVAATTINVASETLQPFAPYDYAIVDFGKEGRHEFMSVVGENLSANDEVICVLRKTEIVAANELISYGIKVKKC